MSDGEHCETLESLIIQQLGPLYRITPHATGCEVVTPLLLPDNSEIAVEIVSAHDNRVEITDAGAVMSYLFLLGIEQRTAHAISRRAARRFGMKLDQGELVLVVDRQNLGLAVIDMAMAVQDATSRGTADTAGRLRGFITDVERFFVDHHQPYERDVPIRGKSGNVRRAHFRIIPSGMSRTLILFALSREDDQAARQDVNTISLYADDMRAGEGKGARFIVLLDDRDPRKRDAIDDTARKTLETYFDAVIDWSHEVSEPGLLIAA